MKRFLLLFLVLCPFAALAQNASVGGTVQDPSGALVPKASVELRNQDTGIRRQTATNGAGYYQLEGLGPGKYDATVQAVGFKMISRDGVVLHVNDQVRLDFRLQLGASTEHVDVDGSGMQINITDGSVSTVIDRKFVENMPLNGRSFQDLISMTPGVVTGSPQVTGSVQSQGDFSVNGQRTESNSYTVDGVSANVGAGSGSGFGQIASSGSIAASTALGTTQSLVSVDALQEFKVASSSYSAEFGRSPGGQFSFSTRSGTNDLHGSIFDYLRNDAFDANDWFNKHNGLGKTALRQNDFGATIGGPVVLQRLYNGRNKSFFFASYEGLRLTQPIAATTQYVPSLDVRSSSSTAIAPIWKAFPLPTGPELTLGGSPSGLAPFLSAYSIPSHINSISSRLDHKLSEKMAIFFRFADTPTYTKARSLSSISDSRFDTMSYTAGATNTITERSSNELRFGYTESTSSLNQVIDSFGGATPIDLSAAMGLPGNTKFSESQPYVSISGIGTATISQDFGANHISQLNVTDTFGLLLGKHEFKIGMDERRLNAPITPPSPYGAVDYYSRQTMISNDAGDGAADVQLSAKPIFNQFSAFLQDQWHAALPLVLSIGIRWEVNPPPTEANGKDAYTLIGNINQPSTLSFAPRGTPLWKTTWYNFAPRVGVAWTAHDRPGHQTVVRVGGGVFFDTGNQVGALGYNGTGFLGLTYFSNVSLPFTTSQFNISTDPGPPNSAGVYAFPAHLQLPYTLQWNASLEQSLGRDQSVSISYVASSGRRLLQEQRRSVAGLNPNFSTIYYFPGGVSSNYQSVQVKFQRAIAHGLQALTSYAWSHSLDFGSTNAAYPLTYGNSDFDVRHNLQAGISWDMPHMAENVLARYLLNDWGLDGRLIVRSAFPITLLGSLRTDSSGNRYYSGVNFDSSRPIYLYGTKYSGGKALNGGPNNTVSPAFTLPAGSNSGNAARNFVRGFGEAQVNLAARREIRVTEAVRMQFRAEAFNLMNHPIFGYINPTLSNAQFGSATKMLNQSLTSMSPLYQQGGPRSIQFALKAIF